MGLGKLFSRHSHTTQLKVTGMTCQHCVHHVTEALKKINEVESVDIDLQPQETSTVNITFTNPATSKLVDECTTAIKEEGYTVL